jgi:hypothetical protein
MMKLESYVAHSQKKRIWFGLPASASFPIILSIPLAFIVGFWGPIAMLVWVVFLKFTDSKGYSFLGFYRRKLRRYAGGYTARPRSLKNIDF